LSGKGSNVSEGEQSRSLPDERLPLVVIAGFMGTGKTETGRALAAMVGLDFADTDRIVEEREGLSVARIFKEKGEAYFREQEEAVCLELAERTGLVLATGGGVPAGRKGFSALASKGQVFLIEASVDSILDRLGADASRPLLRSDQDDGGEGRSRKREKIEKLLEERRPIYHRIERRIDTSGITPQEAACRIAAALSLPFRTVPVRVPDSMTRIETGRGLLCRLGERLQAVVPASGYYLLLSKNVRALFFDRIEASFRAASIPWKEIAVEDGENGKSLEQAGEVIDQLAVHGAERDAAVVAVGGGVTGDLCGFAASIYMRGIPVVHVPTTLLAQVDSSIGGKTAVNHRRAKNLVGSFHQPALVVSDPCALASLPEREIAGGLAEVVKTAVLGSPGLFEFLEKELSREPKRTMRSVAFLERCVAECATVKGGVVERDPFDRGERRILNLGHTLGHAIEAVAGYGRLIHGEAVSIGLVAAGRIAVSRGLFDRTLLERTRSILEACGLPVEPPDLDMNSMIQAVQLDKKKKSGKVRFVLPVAIGGTKIVDDVTDSEMRDALSC